MERDDMPTYYPGDNVELNLEIEHRPNFREITATLVVSPELEGAVSFPRKLKAHGLTTVQSATDGTKTSNVAFEYATVGTNLEPGAVIELREVAGVTTSGKHVVFDLAEVQTPRFYYAAEPPDISPVVKHASTERREY